MADKPANESVVDFSTAAALFPDVKTVFGVTLKPLAAIKDSCLVVLDTNVLLVPYTINPKGLDEVAKAYRKLVGEKRLVIPAQVAREFAKNRPNKLGELYQQLSNKRSKIQPFQRGQYPLLESLPQYTKVVELEKVLDEHLEKYKDAISKVLDHVREWNWNDPVSLLYGELFVSDVVFEPAITKDKFDIDFARRQQYKIPPGYKDGAKDDLGVGDVLIWHSILELGSRDKKDVIFVSADGKSDWFHQSDGPLYPRFELVDEFRRLSGGASFHILKLSDFLDLLDVGHQVVQEVREEEVKLVSRLQMPLVAQNEAHTANDWGDNTYKYIVEADEDTLKSVMPTLSAIEHIHAVEYSGSGAEFLLACKGSRGLGLRMKLFDALKAAGIRVVRRVFP